MATGDDMQTAHASFKEYHVVQQILAVLFGCFVIGSRSETTQQNLNVEGHQQSLDYHGIQGE